MGRPPSDTRERAIAAALVLATRDGVGAVTIEGVAREAGQSKGGVLHHFRTKDALLVAMVEKLVADFELSVQTQALADGDTPGRVTRAFLRTMTSPDLANVGRALLTAVAASPALLDPLRASVRRCFVLLESDGIDPVDAHLVALVADAIWMRAIFDLPPLPPGIDEKVMRRAAELAEPKKPRRPR